MAQPLAKVYGDERTTLEAQRDRYTHTREQFVAHYGSGPVRFIRTPGRINLIGEHTDYNGGFVLPVALDRDVLLAVRRRDDATVRVVNLEAGFAPFDFDIASEIAAAPRGDWRNYFQGAAQEVCRRFGGRYPIHGMDVLVSGGAPFGIPRGAGLSSSTALTVGAALALVTLNEIEIERAALAHLCSTAEWYVGTRGGMMDQFSALLCQRDHALFLDCRPSPESDYRFRHVPVSAGVQIVFVDSQVRHENARGQFNQRVAECKIGVRLLQDSFPQVSQLRDVTPEALEMSEPDFWTLLRDLLPIETDVADLVRRGLDREWLAALLTDHSLPGDVKLRILPRCRHVIGENARVLAGIAALEGGQVGTFGLLMDAAHASMRDDYGASCDEVDLLVGLVRQQTGVLGARITGAGWGGGVVALVREAVGTAWTDYVCASYRASAGLECRVLVCRPGDAGGEVLV